MAKHLIPCDRYIVDGGPYSDLLITVYTHSRYIGFFAKVQRKKTGKVCWYYSLQLPGSKKPRRFKMGVFGEAIHTTDWCIEYKLSNAISKAKLNTETNRNFILYAGLK